MEPMQPFSLLIKPASADCNLRCDYCFYLEKCALYPEPARHRMTRDTLDQLVKSYMATQQETYAFGWQGGEPTLMGVDFFRDATKLQAEYGERGVSVANGLQTNATLIDDELAAHFGKYKFLLGCSLDGPAEVHDRYRLTAGGKPSHAAVMRGIETLRRHGVEFNILVLVSQSNVHRAREVYHYLTDQGFLYHQYIPCVEFDDNGQLLPFAITGEEWGRFLCEIYDVWRPGDTRRVSVREFDSILVNMVDGACAQCTMGTNCRQYFVVEHNGDIYPCDFFVEPELKLGNVHDTTWRQAWDSPTYRAFGEQKSDWNDDCIACPHLDLCGGDCIKHRNHNGNEPSNLSWLCAGLKPFYDHTRDGFELLADEVRRERREEEKAASLQRQQQFVTPVVTPTFSVGRNDPCPCGSGRKFKKCCGR
jgi:uncharacterized protein